VHDPVENSVENLIVWCILCIKYLETCTHDPEVICGSALGQHTISTTSNSSSAHSQVIFSAGAVEMSSST
jgi:hypothetical protein